MNAPVDCLQAKNLIHAGYELTVWNRSPEKCQPLQEIGAKVSCQHATPSIPQAPKLHALAKTTCLQQMSSCLQQMSSVPQTDHRLQGWVVPAQVADSPQAVAEQADVVLAMLADPKAALEVAQSIAKGTSSGELSLRPSLHIIDSFACLGWAQRMVCVWLQGRDMWMCQQSTLTLPTRSRR